MHNLMRLIHFAWPYRWRFVVSVLTGLLVAVLWAANLSTVYPVVSVLYHDQNLQQWSDQRIAFAEERLEALASERLRLYDRMNDEGVPQESLDWIDSRLRDIRQERHQMENRLSRDHFWHWAIYTCLPEDRFRTLMCLLGLLAAIMVLRGVCYFFQETLVGSVTNQALMDLRNQLFRRALRLEPSAFDEHGSSGVMARFTNDVQGLAVGLELIMGRLVREPFRILACLGLACFFNWRLTLLVLAIVPIAVLLMAQVARRLRREARKSLEAISALYKVLQESFQSIKVVKAFNMERFERRRFFRESKVYYRKIMRTVELDSMVHPLTELIGMLMISVVLLIGMYMLITGETHLWGVRLASETVEAAALIQLYIALAGLTDPCRKLSNLYGRLQRTCAAADRVFEQLDREPQVTDPPQAAFLEKCAKGIDFEHITFTYPRGHEPAIYDLNLSIRHGETVALVGPNGCGKSTMVNLLARFYDPQQGTIKIDGIDLRTVKLASLRKQIGLVTQETALFDDTIFNNIRHGHRFASHEQVIEAAKQAFAHDFIAQMPKGYETRIGEQGLRLSGGQRQRIALARAILRDPSILILDEATSAVDVESEVLIQRALETFRQGRTTLIISHRLSILSLVDRIVMLDRGVIVAQGSDAELIRTSPSYRRLRELYFQDANSHLTQRQTA